MDEENEDPYRNDLGWHALNYRTAHTLHAEAMWRELEACVARKVAAERERCAAIADSMKIKGAFPDTEESAQNWCAQYIAELIREG
jgi:hypothetical protein